MNGVELDGSDVWADCVAARGGGPGAEAACLRLAALVPQLMRERFRLAVLVSNLRGRARQVVDAWKTQGNFFGIEVDALQEALEGWEVQQ